MTSISPRLVRYLAIGRHRVPLPRTPLMRAMVGLLLILGGMLPFVPPGPGGIALGFAIISVDHPGLRRTRRRAVIWIGRPLKKLLARFRKPALAV